MGDTRTLVRFALSRLSAAGRDLVSAEDLIVVGADTISGEYEHRFLAARVEALNRAAAAGRSAKLVNCSVSRKPSQLSVRILRRLHSEVEVWARDRSSRRRLAELLERPIALLPDVGCLVEAGPSGAFLPPSDEPFAVFVPNAHFSAYLGVPEDALVAAWAEVVRALPMPVVLLPHDIRDFPGDIALSARLSALTGAPLYVPRDVGDAKDVLARASLCISARMHAAVGALSSGTPTVGLEYLDKFGGQFDWYGSLGSCVPEGEVCDVASILGAVSELLGREPAPPVAAAAWFADGWL